MPRADASRKQSLVEHGFRLPSSVHHRPISYEELRVKLGWPDVQHEEVHPDVVRYKKNQAKTLFVSATPADYELHQSRRVVQQVIRPT